MRKNAQLIIGLVVSLLALALAFRGADLGVMVEALRKANYFVLAIGCLFYVAGLFFRALSWQILLGKRVPYTRAFEALNEGYLLNNLLPFRLGEFGRAYLVSRRNNIPALEALSSIVVERVIDLLMVVVLLMSFLPLIAGLDWARGAVVSSIALGVVGIVALIVIARNQDFFAALVGRVLRWLHWRWLQPAVWQARAASFLEGLSAVREPARALQAAFWSTMAWLAAAFGAFFMLRAFLPEATLTMAFVALMLTAIGAAVPSAPSSAGIFELVVVRALAIFKVDNSLALSFGLTLHAISFLSAVGIGGWALAREGETLAHLAGAAQSLLGGSQAAKTSEPAAREQ
jgi:glycosyltransferase 2 family protein